MDTSLLTTKLYIPPPRANLVPRRRLIHRLDEGLRLGRRLTLICAPAGFGKTTLLSAWIAGLDRPVAWLSFDESDSDPRRVSAYLVAALRTLPGAQNRTSSIGESFLATVSAQFEARGSALLIGEILGSLINEMAALPPFALVLDDYHLVDSPHVHEGVAFMLDHLPASVHLVIASRAEPPLPLARLRARGQLTELTADDLRFTPEEAATFLGQMAGLTLTAEDIVRLESRTEGWIAGLQMASLALQGLREPASAQEAASAFIAAFAGDDRYIMDYLVEEVLRRQAEDVQSFLLQTALLERLNAPLCDAVTDQTGSQAMLEKLERHNLFIFPLDNRRGWYRYHALFAELLQHHLRQQITPQDLAALHGRAAGWCEANGLAAEAIDHALKAPDPERAVRLIEQNALETLRRNEQETLLRWLAALDRERLQSRPLLLIVRAWVAIARGQFDEAEDWVRAAESALAQAGWQREYLDAQGFTPRWMQGNIDAVRSTVARGADRIPLAQRALENLPAADALLRCVIALNLGEAYAGQGDIEAANQAFLDAIAIGQEGGNIISILAAMSGLGELHARLGDLRRAAEVCRQAAALGTEKGEPGGRPVPATGNAHRLLSRCFYEWNDLDAALYHATQAVECCRRWGHFFNLVDAYLTLAHVQQTRGDISGVHQTMAATQRLLDGAAARVRQTAMPTLEGEVGWMTRLLEAAQAHLSLLQGDTEGAAQWLSRWLQEYTVSEEDLFPYMTRPRLLIAQRRYDGALSMLEPALQRALARRRIADAIHISKLQACALYARGSAAQALIPLARALQLAEPGGYIRAFVDRGESIEKLLRQMVASATCPVAPDTAAQILSAFRKESKQAAHDGGLLEPLSDRELEVLRLIAANLSNQDIADTLVVSLNTIKTHIQRLYGKLGVSNRLEAVERARGLGLL
ncbi:MAG TPA: LuxR C-terminal-related transcriptional regulator [Anaerolineae bacterium]|nr:LuxR C-terminal-related transcriptional regulator [Anaerolineae bacterium]